MKVLKQPEKGRRVRITVPPMEENFLFREPSGHALRRQGRPQKRPTPASRMVHPKRKNQQAPALRLFVKALLGVERALPLIALAVLSGSLWFSPRTRLQTLTVEGAPATTHSAIQEVLRSHWREPITLHALPARLEAHLQRWGWVHSARWQPLNPTEAKLVLQPRQPFITLRLEKGQKWFLDSAGFLFRSPNPPLTTPAGEILLCEESAMPPEGFITHTALKRAFHLLCALHQDGRVQQARLLVQPTGEMSLTCRLARQPTTLQVRLGDASALPHQIGLLQALINTNPQQIARWEYVDLKTPTAPALKLRSPSKPKEANHD